MSDYKLTYTFQEKDSRDYIHTTKVHPNNSKLELTTVIKKGTQVLKTVKASPTKLVMSYLPPILNQGSWGTCVANAFSLAVSKQTNGNVLLSRIFLYNLCRGIDYSPLNRDDGTTIRSACRAITDYGVCKENIYPYVSANLSRLPSLTAFQNSKRFRQFTYFFISQDLTSIKNSLATYNSPIIFGIMVYPGFMSPSKNGIIPMPDLTKERFLGGHCITIVGYDDSTQMFMCSNSWGTGWGSNGYCYVPYNYITNPKLARDFCVTIFVY
jgi:C1A family cysteine protease